MRSILSGRGLPEDCRRWANDRAPTIEEIRKLVEYPDRRMKTIVYTMASSGIRLGAWDYLKWGHIEQLQLESAAEKEKRVEGVAKVKVYAGEHDEYIHLS
jgi:hypothetical protein